MPINEPITQVTPPLGNKNSWQLFAQETGWRTQDPRSGSVAALFALAARQGGSASLWRTPGTTNYLNESIRIQIGCIEWTGSATFGNQGITLPVAVTTGIGFVVCELITADILCNMVVGTTTATISWMSVSAATKTSLVFYWAVLSPNV